MNVTPPITGTLYPKTPYSYTFTSTVPATGYQYSGTLSNATFFGNVLSSTGAPTTGSFSFIVDAIAPNATANIQYSAFDATTFMRFPQGVTGVGNDIYYANTLCNQIVKLTDGTSPAIFAGSGSSASFLSGVGTGANIPRPYGICYDSNANRFYIGCFTGIMSMTLGASVALLTGSTTSGFADGVGASARFAGIRALDYDISGDLYVADSFNRRIRKVTPLGVVSTYAGSGTQGYLDSSTALTAQFNLPTGCAVQRSTGDVFVVDKQNYCIRKISAAGVVTTFAGSNSPGYVDATGTTARFQDPTSIVFREADNCLYVTDTGRVRKITLAGVVTTLAGNGSIDTIAGGINQASSLPVIQIGADPSWNLLTTVDSLVRGGVAKIEVPTEVRPAGSRPTDYTIVATTNTVPIQVISPITTVTTTPPIVSGVATLYKYEAFDYTFSNVQFGQSFTVTAPAELSAFVTIDAGTSTASFASTTGFQASYSSLFPISFNALFGANIIDTLTFNVQVLPGRFTTPSPGATATFYANEAISPILFQSDISMTQMYSTPTLPPGLSFAQVDTLGFQYQLQGTPLVASPATAYNIIGRNTQTGRIVSVSNSYRVDSERIVLNLSASSNVSNMLVETPIIPRTVTAVHPAGTLQYFWSQVLPGGLSLRDSAGNVVVSGFAPLDASGTIRIQGSPSLAAAQFFASNNITAYPFTLNAVVPRGSSVLSASIPFTFSFGPSVLFTQEPGNVTVYLNDVLDASDNYKFEAATFFPYVTNISTIFSPDLRSDLSLDYVSGGVAYLVSSNGATYSETDISYTVRAVNSNGLFRDTTLRVTSLPDVVSFTPTTDLCSTFIFSRALSNAKTGYYNAPISFRATSTSGRTIAYNDVLGVLTGTGLSLSNAPGNTVRLVGTPTTTLPLTTLTVLATQSETGASATQNVQFSILPDAATWTVTPTLPNPVEMIQNVEAPTYQFRATTLSELPVSYYSSSNTPVGTAVNSTGRFSGTPTIAGTGVAIVTANTGYSDLSTTFPYTVLPDALLFTTPSNYYSITPGQDIPPIPITAFSYSGIFGSNFTLDPSGGSTFGIAVTSNGTLYGTAVQQPLVMYPGVPVPLYVSAVAGTVSGTFSFLVGANNPGPTPDPYIYFSNQTGAAFPPQDTYYTLSQYGYTSITITPPPYPVGEFPYLYVHPSELPAGLRFNGLTGVISGYPTALSFEQAVTIHALQRTSQLVSTLTIYITVVNPFVTRPQMSAASYTALIRQYTLANAAQNSRDNRVFAGSEQTQGPFAAAAGANVTTQVNVGCDPNCPPPVVPVTIFNPLQVPGCALWLDAVTSVDTSGSQVLRWNDKSGFARNANQIVGTPTYDTSGINGLPAVVLDICSSMYGSLSNSNVYLTSFGVFRSTPSLNLSPLGYHPVLSTADASGNANVTPLASVGANSQGDLALLTERAGVRTDMSASGMLTTWYDGAASYIAVDGSLGTTSNVSTGPFSYVRYGLGSNAGTPSVPTLPWTGYLGEVLVYHAVLTTSNRQKVEGYLAWKWGLQGELPANHPYKNAPP